MQVPCANDASSARAELCLFPLQHPPALACYQKEADYSTGCSSCYTIHTFCSTVILDQHSALDPENKRRQTLLLLPPAVIDCTLPRAPSPHVPHRALFPYLPLSYLSALYPAFFLSIAVTCTAIYFRTTVLEGEVGAGKGCQLTRCRCVGALVSCFESLRLFILSIFMPLLSQIWNKLFDFTKKKKKKIAKLAPTTKAKRMTGQARRFLYTLPCISTLYRVANYNR